MSGFDVSDNKAKPVEAPVSVYPHSRVRDDMDDETWHRIRDQEERERKIQQSPRAGRASVMDDHMATMDGLSWQYR
jgi:hypothetical protein